jgi:hypothetical protein
MGNHSVPSYTGVLTSVMPTCFWLVQVAVA